MNLYVRAHNEIVCICSGSEISCNSKKGDRGCNKILTFFKKIYVINYSTQLGNVQIFRQEKWAGESQSIDDKF